MAPETYVEIHDESTRYRLSKAHDDTLVLDCYGQTTCIETFADGIQLARYCREKNIDLNLFFSKLPAWDKAVAVQFANGIYR